MKLLIVVMAFVLGGCSKKMADNYRHCLKLRVGMSRDNLLKFMGPPDETIPYVEGKSLPYLKGRTAYEWSNVATMSGPNHVSLDDKTGEVESIRCADVAVTAPVFIEPTISTSAASQAPAVPAAAPASETAAPAQTGGGGLGAPGQSLTGDGSR